MTTRSLPGQRPVLQGDDGRLQQRLRVLYGSSPIFLLIHRLAPFHAAIATIVRAAWILSVQEQGGQFR